MAERLAYLEAVVGADITQFRKGMRDVRSEVGLLDESMNGLAAVGRSMTFAVTVPLLALGTGAVQAASEFDSAMRNVNAILQLTEGEFQALSDVALDFGSTIRGGPLAAAQAMYIVASAGITDIGTATSFMEVASRTAEAGLAGLEVTTNALVASFLAFGGGALDAAAATALLEHQSDILTQTVAIGVGSMDVFATALGQVVPTVVAVGGSLEDTGAIMAFLTQRGLSAAASGVSLNAALTALLKPTDAMKAAFGELGVASGDELVAKFGGLEEALIAVIGTADGSATALGELFANVRASRAVSLIANDIDGLNSTIAQFQNNIEGATDRAHEQQMMSFASHWDLMTSAVSGAAIAIGDNLLPVLMPVIDGIADIALQVGQANPEVLALGVGFATLAAAVGPALWLLSSMINPIAALILASGALSTAWVADFGGIRETVSETLTDIFGDLSGMGSLVDEIINTLFPPNLEYMIRDGMPRITVPGAEMVEFVVSGEDEIFQIWYDNFQKHISWEGFVAAVGWVPHEMSADEIMEVPKDLFTGFLTLADPLDSDQIAAAMWDKAGGHIELNPAGGFVWVVDEKDLGSTLSDRIGASIGIAAERIGPQLQVMLENAAAWFDEKAGMGLAWLAGLFEVTAKGGDTPLYKAISRLLEGDIGGAINTIIPGLGTNLQTAVAGWGSSITAAFPQIAAGLGKLFTSIGTWTLEVGIPTLARIAGNIGGHLAASLYDAIAGAIHFLTGGGAAAGAEAVGSYLGDKVAPELAAGFAEGIAGSALETEGLPAIEDLINGILANADTLEIDTALQGLVNLGAGILNLAQDLANADWSGVVRIVGALTIVSNTILSISASALGVSLGLIGDAISSFLSALSLATSGGDPTEIMDKIGEGIRSLADATIGVDLASNTPNLVVSGSAVVAAGIRRSIESILTPALVDEPLSISTAGLVINFDRWDELQLELGDLSTVNPTLAAAIQTIIDATPYPARVGSLEVSLQDTDVIPPTAEQWDAALQNTTGSDWNSRLLEVQLALGTVVLVTDDQTEIIPPTIAPEDLVDPAAFDFTGMTDVSINFPDIAEQIMPTGEAATHVTQETRDAMARIAPELLAATAAGGTADPLIFINGFLIPIQNAFVQYLGADSETIGALSGFTTAVQVNTDLAGLSIMDLLTIAEIDFPLITTTIGAQTPVIIGFLDGTRSAVDSLKDAFSQMAAAARDALSVAGTVPGGPTLDGALADGGNMIAGGNYLVGEEGPEVVTSRHNAAVISNDTLRGSGARSGSEKGGDTYYQTMTVYEASSLDDILREAKRRNIKFPT